MCNFENYSDYRNEETNHTHAANILDIMQRKMNLPSPDLSQFVRQKSQLWKISELPNLQQTKLPTSNYSQE